MSKKAKSAFPKTLFVKWDGSDRDRYLSAHAFAENLAEIHEEVEVAVYKLERIGKVKTLTEGP